MPRTRDPAGGKPNDPTYVTDPQGLPRHYAAYPRAYIIALLHYYALAYAVPFAYLAATCYRESGFDPWALGDFDSNGVPTSSGLFMLHEGGELPKGKTIYWANVPDNNCGIAVPILAHAWHHTKGSPGKRAATAQRPKDPAGYASDVDNYYNAILKEGVGKACPSPKVFNPHSEAVDRRRTDAGVAKPEGITGGLATGTTNWLLSHLGLPNIGVLLRVAAGGIAVLVGVLILFHPGVNVSTIAKTAGKAALL